MIRGNNYLIQAQQAKRRFLTYDQEKLIRKFRLKQDAGYLYPVLLGDTYRISRTTGDMDRREGEAWVDGNSYEEVMTILDLLCDSREDRWLTGRLQSFQSFGRLFYSGGKESARDPWALWMQDNLKDVCRVCRELGGQPVPGGDAGFAFALFEDLKIAFQFWAEDEDFPPKIQWFWEENALMYLRFETMHFVTGLLLRRLKERI